MPPLRLPSTALHYLAPPPHTMTRPSIIHSTIIRRCSSRMDSSTTSSSYSYPSIPTTTEKMFADYRAAEALREQTRMLQAQQQPKVEEQIHHRHHFDSQHHHHQTKLLEIQTELREVRRKVERMDVMEKEVDEIRQEFDSCGKWSAWTLAGLNFWMWVHTLWLFKVSKEQKAARGGGADDVDTETEKNLGPGAAATASNPSEEGLQRLDGARS